MIGRRLVALAVAVPSLALAALLIWGIVKSGGNPGSLFVNDDLGEVAVTSGEDADFELVSLTGETIRLSDLTGQVVMVDFWSTWCPPCIVEGPALAAAYREFRDLDVEFVGVAIWDQEGPVRDFVRRVGAEYPVVMDNKGAVAVDFGVRGLPEKFFVNREGRIVKKFIGPMSERELAAILNELLQEPGPARGGAE